MALNLTKPPPDLLPPLVPDTRVAPEDIMRVHAALDLPEALVILAPEDLLPIWLVNVGLDGQHSRQTNVKRGVREVSEGKWK